ncbi:pyrroline-5-carboxylate reductase [Myceligenerans pegani]|uniref:Pyrroline-5-carboxylate reductase n=1 Tax=Myceligenerans pegani TaxID=2776917 RepID=A0ABR9N5M7_9MICO|nr:pyrroline-5-carboxylate reductase [Myceligenerans sp. TRM 65318]MBE1878665.1 pyrroline-5-carboxylate reductase [Myceligenerans sp. TRM 65318]MBE3020936.1 pyrroline-5-carboxylate reductase [Myceligenerans sp. TRM 65318]
MTERVAILGTGNMGEAVLAGAIGAGWSPGEIVATVRATAQGEARGASLRDRHGVATTTDNAAAATDAGLVVVAVKPKDVPAVLDEIAPALADAAVVVSVAAGVTTAAMEARLRPGTPVVRTMPNTPAQIGAGITAVAPGAAADDSHLTLVERFLAGTGDVVRVAEKDLDAVTALSGGGPAYVFLVIDALAEAGVHAGLKRDVAARLARQTVLGAARLTVETGEHPAILRERVTSPAGTTAAGLRVLEDRAVRAAFLAAVEAARARSAELGA